jgi:toxin-antitoxin system PIN domain toxin
VISLLDINVLVALAWPNHEHHALVTGWFHQNEGEGWATCPVSESGFIRVSSNQRAIPGAKSPVEAAELLIQITSRPNHVFLSDDISLAASKVVALRKLTGYRRQVTDAHLLGIALRHGARLATLDGGILDLVPPGYSASEAVYLIR